MKERSSKRNPLLQKANEKYLRKEKFKKNLKLNYSCVESINKNALTLLITFVSITNFILL